MKECTNNATIHATSICINDRAWLITGLSGSGKTRLALMLLNTNIASMYPEIRHVQLIADDRTIITRKEMRLIAEAPETLSGRIEVRGHGICCIQHKKRALIAGIFEVGHNSQERMRLHIQADHVKELEGVCVPSYKIDEDCVMALAQVNAAILENLKNKKTLAHGRGVPYKRHENNEK